MKKKQSLLPIIVTVFIDLLGVGIIIPILASLFLSDNSRLFSHETSFQIRSIFLGLLTASYPFMQFIASPVIGALSDRLGRKPVLVYSLLGTCIGYVLFAIGLITNQLWLLFFSRMLDGVTGGNIATAMSAIADISEPKDKAKNFGLVGMSFGLGFILGPFLGGVLSDSSLVPFFSFSTPFFVASILTFINILLLLTNFTESLQTTVHRKVTLLTGVINVGKAFSHVNLRVLFITIFLYTLGFNFFTQFFQVYLIENFRFSQSTIGLLFGYMGVWIAITQGFLTRVVTRKFKAESILKVTLFLLPSFLLILIVPKISWWPYIILPFIAMSNGLTMPTTSSIISNSADSRSQGEILGINQSIQALGQTLPPLIAGFIASIDTHLPTFVGSLLIFLGWSIFMVYFKPNIHSKFHEE